MTTGVFESGVHVRHDDDQDIGELLEQRLADSEQAQIIEWATGSLERVYTVRLNEVRDTLDFLARRGTGVRSSAERSVPPRVRRKLAGAVDGYISALENHVRTIASALSSEAIADEAIDLPYEHVLVATNLLVAGEQLDGLTATLTAQIHSAAEMATVEDLFSERIGSNRSPVVVDGLLVASMGALEELVAALLRLSFVVGGGVEAVDDRAFVVETTRKAAKAIRGGPARWRPAVLERTGLDPAALVSDWALLVEAHQRRNAIVHNGGRVDAAYLRNASDAAGPCHPGEPLVTDAAYLGRLVASLRALGSGLATVWPVVALERSTKRRLLRPNRSVVELLHGKHWGDASSLATVLERYEADAAARAALRVNSWMARRELAGSAEAIGAEVEHWDPPGDDPSWEIARAALLERYDELATLLSEVGERRVWIDADSWPLLKVAAERSTAIRRLLYRKRRTR